MDLKMHPSNSNWRRLRIILGPLPKSWTLTQARDGLNPREALRVAELPPTIRRIVEREMPRVRPPTITEPDRVPEPPPVSEPSPPTNVRVNIGVTPRGTIEVGKSPAPFPASKPPPQRVIEKKLKVTKSLGAKIFKALDTLSESAEKVDCIHKSLPKKMQAKKLEKSRGLLDSAGQYGIDEVDQKIPAIYKNFQHVDWGRALHCIALNEIEDGIIGRMNAGVRKVYRGPADMITGEPGKRVAKILDPDKGVFKYPDWWKKEPPE